jgi:hypothetical protein
MKGLNKIAVLAQAILPTASPVDSAATTPNNK